MNFLAPLAFVLAALLPIIVALYFLKLRRKEQPIASTYLWRTLVRDTAANAPWQRLKPNLLLLLQLLFLIALIVALARPFLWSTAITSGHLILVLDTSASMGATDVAPSRLGNAVAQARELVSKLPADVPVSVIEAGAQVRVPVSGAVDKNAAYAALDALRPGLSGTDMPSALTLTAALAAQEPDSQVVILSDGHFELPENLVVPANTQFISVGNTRENQAIGTFTLQPAPGGKTLTAFVQLTNYGTEAVTRRLVLRDENGQLVTARDVTLAADKAQALTLTELAAESGALQAQLEGTDALALDDRAWAVAPLHEKTSVRVVTSGNRFLETALALLPNVEVTTVKPADAITTTTPALTLFDSTVPTATLPAGNLLFIAPPRSTEFFSVTGTITSPLPIAVTADDPVLHYVDWQDVAIEDATQIALPSWGHAVLIDSNTSAPLLVVGEQDGRRLGILSFDVRHSDLPLRVAFPLLMANLLDALVPGGAAGIPTAVEPGRALTLGVPTQATALVLRTPDGNENTLTPEQGRVVFNQTDEAGIYSVSTRDREGKTELVGRFAVNGSNAAESDIMPRADLGLTSAVVANATGTERARDEWWQPLAWLALVLLVIEWLVAYRGQLKKVLSLTHFKIALPKRRDV